MLDLQEELSAGVRRAKAVDRHIPCVWRMRISRAGIRIGSHAGEMLDEHAKAAYRHRLCEPREEPDEAKRLEGVARVLSGRAMTSQVPQWSLRGDHLHSAGSSL